MEKLLIASTRQNAGKTCIIVGLAKLLNRSYGYIKPFGDRLLYRKKRLCDYDASLISFIFGMEEPSEDVTLGFDHSKLRYMYDEESLKKKLADIAADYAKSKDVLFIEAGMDIIYGHSVHLDAFSIARYIDAKIIFVISGGDEAIIDEISFIKRYADREAIEMKGIILNKIHDPEDFRNAHMDQIRKAGINVLGIIPYRVELNYFSVDYLSEALFAKVIAGEGGLNNTVNVIFIGAMSENEALRHPAFSTDNKLVITSGDRIDIILASLEGNTSAVIITNNILPPSNIIARASERKIPLLLVSTDVYQTAKKIDSLEPLLTKTSLKKFELLEELVKNNVDISKI